MTTQAVIYTSALRYSAITRELIADRIKVVRSQLPRPCMLISGGLLFTGLGIPTLMGLAIIPASLFLGFIGLSLFCVGLVTTLYNLDNY